MISSSRAATISATLTLNRRLSENNVFKLNFEGASIKELATYREGTLAKRQAYVRGDRSLPLGGPVDIILHALQQESALSDIHKVLVFVKERNASRKGFLYSMSLVPEIMEAMIHDAGSKPATIHQLRSIPLSRRTTTLRWNTDTFSA